MTGLGRKKRRPPAGVTKILIRCLTSLNDHGELMIGLTVVESSAIERTHTIPAISLHSTVVGEVTKT
jgi:hypothetical protein